MREKKRVKVQSLLMALVAFIFAGAAGEEAAAGSISFSAKATYASKYVWRGYDVWNNNPAFMPDISLDMDGYYAGIWSAYSIEDGCVDPFGDVCSTWDEHDFYVGAYGALWDGSRGATEYDISYTYFQFYRLRDVDNHEALVTLAHPSLLGGLFETPPVFYWGVAYGQPVSGAAPSSLWLKAGLKYSLELPASKAQMLVETFWDDGAGSFEAPVGFSHVRVGGHLEFTAGGFTFKPSAYYIHALKQTDPETLLESEYWYEILIGFGF
ncbi:MAG: hypothetical protein OEY50_08290 [Nitrospinota bacterium]|nr:hypothetical protein [Nitrospinota bacterium]